jgi:hypothetical protein
MNTPRLILLLKSGPGTGTSIAHKGGYALYGNPPRWRKITHDAPAPKGAPVAAHPKSAGHHEAAAHFTDDQWSALKLPDSNVNAPVFNKALEKLRAWSDAGDVTAIVGASFGSNTYGQKLAKIANHLLGLHGSAHTVTPGQKPGTHAAAQVAEPADPHPTGLPEHLAPKEPAEPPEDTQALKDKLELLHDFLSAKPDSPNAPAWKAKIAEIEAKVGPLKTSKPEPVKPVVDTSSWSDPAKAAHALNTEYKALDKLNNKAVGAFKTKLRALAKKTPEDDAHATLILDGLVTKLWGTDYDPKVAGVEFAPPEPAAITPASAETVATGTVFEFSSQYEKMNAGKWVVYNQNEDQYYLNKLGAKVPGQKNTVAIPKSSLHTAIEKGTAKPFVESAVKKLTPEEIKAAHANLPGDGAMGFSLSTLTGKLAHDSAMNGDADGIKVAHKQALDKGWHGAAAAMAAVAGAMGVHVTDTGPKEGDTKPGANGSTMVLKDGHWQTQGGAFVMTPSSKAMFDKPASKGEWSGLEEWMSPEAGLKQSVKDYISSLLAQKPAATTPGALSAQQLQNLQSIPWFKLKLPAENTNAKSHNAALAKIEAMAFAGDTAGLQAFIDSKAGAKQTYAKKQALTAQTALAGLGVKGATAAVPVEPAPAATPVGTKLRDFPGVTFIPSADGSWSQKDDSTGNLKAIGSELQAALHLKVGQEVPGWLSQKLTIKQKAAIIKEAAETFGKSPMEMQALMDAQAPAPAPAAPAAPPAQPAAPVSAGGMLPMDGWAQTGGQGGSNPGGKFKDQSGQEWYCKFPADADTAKSEVLAAKLYALAGLSSQDAVLVTKGGKVGIASKWVDIKKAATPGALAKVDGAQAGFAVDAWLGNWDVVGLGYDNLQVGPDGKAHRVDAGGSLEYRAQGEKKPFGSKVDELDTLLDAGKNPQAASVFKGMTKADLTASAAKVLAISDVAIRAMVNQYGPGDAAAKTKLAETLIARKADLAKRFPAAVKKKKAPVFKPEDISAPPSFLNWGGNGSSGPSSKEFLNKANEEAVQAVFAAAKTGDLDAIKGLTAPVYDKDSGQVVGHKPVLEHPSQHVKGYAQQAINEINYQLNPPKKFRFDGGHPLHSLNAAYPAFTGPASSAVAQKLGKFIVLGEPGSVNLADLGLPEKIKHAEGGGALSAQNYAKQAQAAIAKMPATQKQAVKSYTGSSYKAMNGSLWDGNPSGAAKAAGEALKTLAHDIAPGTVLSRKISLHGSDLDQLLKSSGKILQEPAIMSTSIRPSSWHGNVHLKLHVGPGVKGLWVGYHSIAGGGALSSNAGEDEMILPPGTRLMILSVKGKDGDADGFGKSSSHVIEAVILPTE